MKYTLLSLLLLAGIAGHGQTPITQYAYSNVDTCTGCSKVFSTLIIPKQNTAQYDTLKVIAEVYELPEKVKFDGIYYWPIGDSTHVYTYKVMAWEVWRKEIYRGVFGNEITDKYFDIEKLKTLAYNKKDELTHVLQSWRVQW